MNFVMEKLGFDAELNRGFIASVVFHIALFLFAWFGVPHLFQDEIIAEPLGIEAAIVSDLTAAPKVDRPSKKVSEKPKQTQKVEPPKKETKPAPAKENPKPASAPPPPEPEQQAVVIPDQTKPKEPEKVEKKPEEKPKKKTEEKKKEKKKDKAELDNLLASVLNEQAAEPTPEKPKKQAAAEPEESTGPVAPEVAPMPMTASDQDGIKQQLIPCWNFDAGTPNPEQYVVTVRVTLDPSGAVLGARVLEQNRMGDPRFAVVARGAVNAVKNPACTPLRLPAGKHWDEIDVVFDLAKAINGGF